MFYICIFANYICKFTFFLWCIKETALTFHPNSNKLVNSKEKRVMMMKKLTSTQRQQQILELLSDGSAAKTADLAEH